jgi:hypothetical protein
MPGITAKIACRVLAINHFLVKMSLRKSQRFFLNKQNQLAR